MVKMKVNQTVDPSVLLEWKLSRKKIFFSLFVHALLNFRYQTTFLLLKGYPFSWLDMKTNNGLSVRRLVTYSFFPFYLMFFLDSCSLTSRAAEVCLGRIKRRKVMWYRKSYFLFHFFFMFVLPSWPITSIPKGFYHDEWKERRNTAGWKEL